MPVDDAVLEKTIEDLQTKLNEVSTLRHKLKVCHRSAQSIRQVDVPDPTPEDTARTKKEIPEDRALGKKFTSTRRQEIFDKIESDKTALLA